MAALRVGPAVPGSLRQINRLTVLRLLRKLGTTTKPALASASGISRPTVSKVVDELETAGLAERVGIAPSSAIGGKPGILYRFNANGIRSGAVFLRVDTVQVAVIDGNGRVHAQRDSPLGNDRRPEPVISLIVATLSKLLAELQLTTQDLLGIGVGVPGLTSYHAGVVHFAPHLPEWSDVPLCDLLARRLQIGVWVDNDCHVQALAERYFGLGQDGSEFVTVQSGIGLSAAFYVDGTLYRGSADTAGEIGHMIVQEDGRLCHCGSWGCWETLASITWLVDEVCRAPDGGFRLPEWLEVPDFADQSYQSVWDIDPTMITRCAHAVFQAARKGQTEAISFVRQHGYYFGVGLVNLTNMFNPQRIIIWGDDVAAGDLFLEAVSDTVKKRTLARPRETCEIVFSPIDQEVVGLIGAGTLAIDALFEGI
jgi:predicted NBD/HSP70 family sugar kinase